MIKVDISVAFDHLYKLANEMVVGLVEKYPALSIETVESKKIRLPIPEEIHRFVGDISVSCAYRDGSFVILTHPDVDGGKLSILRDWMKNNKEFVIKYTIEALFDVVYKVYSPIHFTDFFKPFFDTYKLYRNFYFAPLSDTI